MANDKKGLVLSGGGARGAYQVGVLKALQEMYPEKHSPFPILAGASAGAINTGQIASLADDFSAAITGLLEFWSNLNFDQVFRTDLRSLGVIGMQWMKDLSLGGMTGTTSHKALLDTEPLRQLLTLNVPIHRIGKNIESGILRGISISAINYYSGNTVNFIQGQEDIPMWNKMQRLSEKTQITVEHLMGSSAIPIIFPSIEVDQRHFGDGCVRNMAPLSPAVHMGAEKIIAVGVRYIHETSEDMGRNQNYPSIAQMSSVILNSILLDALELDVARVERINKLTKYGNTTDGEQVFRPIKVCMITPSENIGKISTEYQDKLPRIIKYLLKGLGPDAGSTDMISYLMFTPEFMQRLIELGYNDAHSQKENIMRTLE